MRFFLLAFSIFSLFRLFASMTRNGSSLIDWSAPGFCLALCLLLILMITCLRCIELHTTPLRSIANVRAKTFLRTGLTARRIASLTLTRMERTPNAECDLHRRMYILYMVVHATFEMSSAIFSLARLLFGVCVSMPPFVSIMFTVLVRTTRVRVRAQAVDSLLITILSTTSKHIDTAIVCMTSRFFVRDIPSTSLEIRVASSMYDLRKSSRLTCCGCKAPAASL